MTLTLSSRTIQDLKNVRFKELEELRISDFQPRTQINCFPFTLLRGR